MATYFTPPTRRNRLWLVRPHGLLSRLHLDSGLTVLKNGGFYTTVENPAAEDVEAADAAYLGGRAYEVTTEEADALTAAGYGSYLTTS